MKGSLSAHRTMNYSYIIIHQSNQIDEAQADTCSSEIVVHIHTLEVGVMYWRTHNLEVGVTSGGCRTHTLEVGVTSGGCRTHTLEVGFTSGGCRTYTLEVEATSGGCRTYTLEIGASGCHTHTHPMASSGVYNIFRYKYYYVD